LYNKKDKENYQSDNETAAGDEFTKGLDDSSGIAL
jgi:hypothetical protein